VIKINIVPTTEKQEAILSVVSSAASWLSVRGMTTARTVQKIVAVEPEEGFVEQRSKVTPYYLKVFNEW